MAGGPLKSTAEKKSGAKALTRCVANSSGKPGSRSPTEMDHFHEGYDVESRNNARQIERFIEVKAVSAAWG